MSIAMLGAESLAARRLARHLSRHGYEVVRHDGSMPSQQSDLLLAVNCAADRVDAALTAGFLPAPLLWLSDLDPEAETRWLDRGVSLILPAASADEEVRGWIAQLIRLAAPTADGDLSLDAIAARARYRGVDLDLPPIAFSLLWHLSAAAGQVVSADRLRILLWPDQAPSPGRLALVLYRLRRSLARVGARDLLQTLRGRGYRLQSPRREIR